MYGEGLAWILGSGISPLLPWADACGLIDNDRYDKIAFILTILLHSVAVILTREFPFSGLSTFVR